MRAGGIEETQTPVIRPKQIQRERRSQNWDTLERILRERGGGDTYKASRKRQGVAAVMATARTV